MVRASPPYCGIMPASLMIRPHLSISLLRTASSVAGVARSCSTGATLSSAKRLTKGGFLSAFCRALTNGRKVVNGVERQLGDAAACVPPGLKVGRVGG